MNFLTRLAIGIGALLARRAQPRIAITILRNDGRDTEAQESAGEVGDDTLRMLAMSRHPAGKGRRTLDDELCAHLSRRDLQREAALQVWMSRNRRDA